MLEENTAEELLNDGADISDDEHLEPAADQDEKPEPRGYMSKEAWIASGKDPKEWVSEEVYRERGERIKQTTALKREYDNQIRNLNLLHQVQLKNQRDELERRRDGAIEVADKASVKSIDKQIKELDRLEALTEQEQVAAKPREVVEWEEDNPWCQNKDDPRLIVANRIYVEAINAGKTIASALRLVDKEISSKFSDKRSAPAQIVEGARKSTSKSGGDDMPTMKTLTREEQKAWDSGLFSSEKEFLKAVLADRKGTK